MLIFTAEAVGFVGGEVQPAVWKRTPTVKVLTGLAPAPECPATLLLGLRGSCQLWIFLHMPPKSAPRC